MRAKELAQIVGLHERSIRRHTKIAIEKGLDYIYLNEEKYCFKTIVSKTARGKAYEYTKAEEEQKEVDKLPDLNKKLGDHFIKATAKAKKRRF